MGITDQFLENSTTLADSFEQHHFVLDKLPYAIAVFDKNMRYLTANEQWLQDYELDGQTLLGKNLYDVFPETPDVWRSIYERVLTGETIISQDERFQNPKGDVQFLNWRAFPWYGADKTTPAGIVVVTLDNTPTMAAQIKRENILSKTAEERRRRAETLSKINAALSQATNEDEILTAVAKYIDQKRPTAMYLCYVDLDETGKPIYITITSSWLAGVLSPNDPAINIQYRVSDFSITELWLASEEKAVLVEDHLTDSRMDASKQAYMEQSNFRALAMIPLYSSGKWQGVISIHWDTPQTFTDEEQAIYNALVRTTGAVVATRRAYLREESIRHRAETVAKVNADLAQAVDEQEILRAVAKLAEQYKVSISGLNFIESGADNEPDIIEIVALQSGDGQPLPLTALPRSRFPANEFPTNQMMFADPDHMFVMEDAFTDPRLETGNTREFLKAAHTAAYIALPLYSGDQWQGLLSFSWSDPQQFSPDFRAVMEAIIPTAASVVASRRAYLTVEATRKQAQAIAEVNANLAQATSEQDILDAVAVLVEPYGLSLSSLTYPHVDADGKPIAGEVVAIRSGDGQPIPLSTWEVTYFPNEYFPVSGLIYGSQDHLLFIEDAFNDPRLESDQIREFLKSIQQPAFISMALKIGTQWQGILTFAWTSPQKFDTKIRNLLVAVLPTAAAVVASRRLYLQTLENVKRLREMDTLKNEFLSNMSHELRTPLNAVIGLSDVILSGLDGPISERLEHDIQTIFNAGQQLLAIVNDVLDIAKIEAGVLTLSQTSVEIPKIVLAGLNTVQVQADAKALIVKSTIPDDLPAVWADKNRVQQIMNNLLANAVKFTDEGSVEVSAYVENKQVVVCIKDEGIGIKSQDHELIFQQFRQVEGSITRKKGGAGLGLPISKRLVELHGGSMWLVSELEQGASFYFSLPIVE